MGSEKQMFETPLLIKGHLVFQLKMFERFSKFSIAFIEFNEFIWKERKLTSMISINMNTTVKILFSFKSNVIVLGKSFFFIVFC